MGWCQLSSWHRNDDDQDCRGDDVEDDADENRNFQIHDKQHGEHNDDRDHGDDSDDTDRDDDEAQDEGDDDENEVAHSGLYEKEAGIVPTQCCGTVRWVGMSAAGNSCMRSSRACRCLSKASLSRFGA